MNIERAIQIAVEAHAGATDKGGNPYILHPLRVMMGLGTETEQIVGVLHDVVEDVEEWTFERLLKEGFSAEIVDALSAVTKTSDDEDYNDFIERISINPLATKVKIADITDNMDVSRLAKLDEKAMNRLNKYKRAINRLQEKAL